MEQLPFVDMDSARGAGGQPGPLFECAGVRLTALTRGTAP
jgi:hypothetical protein